MAVLLPSSDQAWFSESPVLSARLQSKPIDAWKTLQDCPNQDERAWFLIANYLLSVSHDLSQLRNGISPQEKQELEIAFHCFRLALPPNFNLEMGTFVFDASDFSRGNWIISTHLMLAACSDLVVNLPVAATSPNRPASPTLKALQPQSRPVEMTRIISHWPSDFISTAHPFIACTIIPVYIPGGETDMINLSGPGVSQVMPKLVLSHFARMWALGTILLSVFIILERPRRPTPEELSLVRRFAVFFPSRLRRNSASTNTTIHTALAPGLRMNQDTDDPGNRGWDNLEADHDAGENDDLINGTSTSALHFDLRTTSGEDRMNDWDTIISDFLGHMDNFQ